MTALCGGGTSSAQTSFGLGVTVGTGALAALLNNVPTPQAVAIAAVIGVLNFELSTFCTTDPPAMPTFTAQDYLDVLGGRGTLAQLAAADKFRDAIGNIVWPTFCKCDSTSTPAPPAMPTAPIGLPAFEPPALPTGQISAPCWDKTTSLVTVAPSGVVDISNQCLPPTTAVGVTPPFTGAPSVARAMPTGTNNILEQVTWNENTAGGSAGVTLYMFNSAGTVVENIGPYDGGPVAGVTVTNHQLQPTTAVSWYMIVTNGDSITHHVTTRVQFYCSGGSPNTIATPCCPPDPSLELELQAIRAMLDLIYQGLPTSVNSYATGAVHTGLSGNGTLTLTGAALAIRVNITTDPVQLGVDLGDPNYLFDRGYIVPVVNAAPIRGQSRLVYNPQLFLLPTLTEQIGYSLHPGVVITITELLRGP